MIAIDIGSADHSHESSTERLITRFHPTLIVALDPHPTTEAGVRLHGETIVATTQAAAWTQEGQIGYHEESGSSRVLENPDLPQVPCIDIAEWITGFEATVLKLDCEGAEYTLLPHLIDQQLDRGLELVWVEWHVPYTRKREIEQTIRCPLEEWLW